MVRRHSLQQAAGNYVYTTDGSPRYYIDQTTYVVDRDFTSFDVRKELPLPTYDPNFAYWGPKAFNRMLPVRNGKLGQFVAEATDIPHIPRLINSLRRMAEEYINVEFGWKPLLNDLRTIAEVVPKYDDIWRQLVRAHHRVHKKRFVLYDDVISSSSSGPYRGTFLAKPGVTKCYPGFVASGNEYLTVSTVRRMKVWCSGQFRVGLPNVNLPGIPEADFRRWRHALGVFPTPSLVYKVTPWTWLIDWYTNLGVIIDNWEAYLIDGVVADYAYVMCHIREDETRVVTGPYGNGRAHYVREVLARDRANPYGFGLSNTDLTLSQKAILTALGILKAPRSTR